MTTKKDDFISTMEALKQQSDYDKVWSETMTTTLGADVIPIYNNGILVQTLISEMCSWFPDAEEAKREISRFMYDLDFGRCKGCEVISVEDLWESLSPKKSMLPKYIQEYYNNIKTTGQRNEEVKVNNNFKKSISTEEESRKNWEAFNDNMEKQFLFNHRPDTRDDMEVKTDESDFQEIESILEEFRDWDREWAGNGLGLSVGDFAKQLSKKYEVKKKK